MCCWFRFDMFGFLHAFCYIQLKIKFYAKQENIYTTQLVTLKLQKTTKQMTV